MKLLLSILVSLMLVSCAPVPTKQELSYDGIPYTLVLDEYETPCGRISFREGCTVTFTDGQKPIVYVSSLAPKWVIDHELEHVKGMKHGGWRETPDGWCTNVYFSGTSKKYGMGDIICNNARSEWVIPVLGGK